MAAVGGAWLFAWSQQSEEAMPLIPSHDPRLAKRRIWRHRHIMHSKKPRNEPSLDLLAQMGYETRDVAFRTLAGWIAALFAFAIGTSFVMAWTFRWFAPDVNEVQKQHAYPLAFVRRLPPNPQIQADPKRDMKIYHAGEDASITQLHWANEAKTKVNIPIDRAMDEMAAKGISGISGSAKTEFSPSYPGSGDYKTSTKGTITE